MTREEIMKRIVMWPAWAGQQIEVLHNLQKMNMEAGKVRQIVIDDDTVDEIFEQIELEDYDNTSPYEQMKAMLKVMAKLGYVWVKEE